MKKVLLIGIAAIGLSCFSTSCTKTYKCKNTLLPPGTPGRVEKYDEDDYSDEEINQLKKECQASGKKWTGS